ncbi:hypothetical protein GCM10027265_10920 [Jatrophihabitans fulvus]
MLAVVAFLVALGLPGTAAALPRSQVQAQQWWLDRLGLDRAWQVTRGQGVTIAIVDSGVNADFGDLRGAVLPGFVVGGSGDGWRDTDKTLHGTRMADNAAGRGTGFGLLGSAPRAKILPVQIDYSSGDGQQETATALDRLSALADPPGVVNMSFGSNGTCTPELQQSVQRATAKGMILVAAAGNTGDGANTSEAPANCTGVVAVGAYGNGDTPRLWSGSTRQPYVALAGPGARIIGVDTSAASGYGYAFGTSEAAAIVSGGFALLRAKYADESPRRIVARMLYTARQFEGRQGARNSSWGFGVARPRVALTDPVPTDAPNPIYDALDQLDGSGSPSSPGSSPTSAPSSAPTAGTPASGPVTDTPGGATTPAPGAQGDDDGGGDGVIIGVLVAVVVLLAIVLAVVLARRRRPSGPPGGYPPAPPTGWGGP